jgi:hypothetical protein
MGPYLVKHGQRPLIILWYVVPVHLAGHEILIFAVSGPRVVSPRACRRPNIFVFASGKTYFSNRASLEVIIDRLLLN